MKNIAVFGSGPVGGVLSNAFLSRGYPVMRATRDPAKLQPWKSEATGDASVGTYAEAAAWADIVVFAVKGMIAEEVLEQAGPANLAGKLVIDTTNPMGTEPPDHGVLRYFTNANESLMERLQKKVPAARFVKAFNAIGNAYMVDPDKKFDDPPSMFICGNDAAAKQETIELLTKLGWECVDMGGVEGARPIESLCILWCIPGFTRGEWAHGFKLVKARR
jgi:8-hydroxy-5-deazaflavin:NADPH oxidoreductase